LAAHGIAQGERFTRAERLRRRKEYERVYREGKRLNLPYLKVVLAPNELGYCRLGLSVSRKFGKAVKRNLAKRRLREIFRRHKGLFPAGHDVIFIPKPGFLEQPQQKIIQDLAKIFQIYEKNRSVSR